MSSITVQFQFEIGDIVYFRQSPNNMDNIPNRFLVTERLAQQCHGGIQMLYRLHDRDALIPEVAIRGDCPPFQPDSDERVAERQRLLRAEHEVIKGPWMVKSSAATFDYYPPGEPSS